ncbi:hypothetical protein [Spiroplasma endosymbiont of Danaus chrysippus]|uniref:hypothetical protein n=1 Tax=Spiroplasma endosymbiont of Danaus chrysippus TaxID=2691041 RepID=UPI00157B84EC|nr:hypothetical protein [Spiroplasma endosymbiont of Danaus chrysippus]
MLSLFKRKEKSNISDNQNEKVKFLTNKNKSTHASILNYFGFNDFNHETYFTDFVAENNANLYNAPLEINNETIKQYLIQQEFYRKNWNSIFKLSKLGISGYLIYIANDDLYFQVIDIQQRVYDITGKLIQCTIFYDSYQQNAQTVRLFEIYTLNNEQVIINRAIYSINDSKNQFPLDFNSFINNPNLLQEQTLNINYIPIAIMRNKANELADCDKVMDKIKALDVIYEQIVLDTILNSPKFIFSQTYGNVQSALEEAVRTLVTKNYIFKSGGDNNEQNENINMTNSNFKGKNLTDIYDWNVNEIFKRCGIHIPSQKKSAQQSVPESTAVNISTINYIEQKLWQFNIDILKFIQILVTVDKDLLNSKTFNINDEQEINNLTVKLKLFNPENNQLIGENNGKQQQTTNEVSTETN